MTPEEFADEMRKIVKRYINDPEVCHNEMDELMTSLLISLGYEEGVEIFDGTPKWYA